MLELDNLFAAVDKFLARLQEAQVTASSTYCEICRQTRRTARADHALAYFAQYDDNVLATTTYGRPGLM